MARLRTSGGWLALAGITVLGCRVDLLDPFAAGDDGDDEMADEGDEGLAVEGDESGGASGEGEDDDASDQDDGEGMTPLFDVLEDDQGQLPSCEFAASSPGHLGCEFFGLDLDQAGLADFDPYGFVVVNPQMRPVEVTLERHALGWMISDAVVVPPGQMHVFLPADLEKTETGLFANAVFRLHSDHPIVAIQASPAAYNDSNPGFSASATLLLPSAAWTSATRVAGWRSEEGLAEFAFLGIISLDPSTPVNVDLAFEVEADPPEPWADPIASVLGTGDLLRISARPDPMRGLAGSRVSSGQEHHTGVFAAHSCAGVPSYEGWCGHMQEQLVTALLGRHFIVPRLLARVDGQGDDVPELLFESTVLQVVSDQPNTTVELHSSSGEVLESFVIDPTEPWTVELLDEDVVVMSDKPIAVAAYMTHPQFTELGSASMVQLPPIEQWTTAHWVWVPQGFTSHLLVLSDGLGAVEISSLGGVPFAPLPDEPPMAALPPLAPDLPLATATVFTEGLGLHYVSRWAVAPGIYRIDSATPSAVVVSGARELDGFAYLGGWGPSLIDIGPPS